MKLTFPMRVVFCIGAGALLAGPAPVRADWWGQTVTADWLYPDSSSVLETHNVVVGAGIELTPAIIINDDKFSIDLGADTVLFEFNATSNWSPTSFNGWRFSDTLGTIPDITGYTIDSYSAGISGLAQGDLGFNANAVWGNFSGMTVAGGGEWIKLKVSFIPEPASLSLLAVSLLALLRRR